jgi:endonuclease/exonuclease/phosphatase (EEP) superfamily protein YafD
MRSICSRLATAALVSAAAATAIGYLAPCWPKADMPNHFTPLILAVAVAGLALLAFESRKPMTQRRTRLALAAGLAGLAAINTAPVLGALATTAVAAQGATDTLTVVSFNVWTKNQRLDEATRWLVDQKADVIVLQEMTPKSREFMKRELAATYPHLHDCDCNDIVMFSRRPWTAAGGQPRTAEQPAMSWFTLVDRNGREIRVIGLRPRYIQQAAEYAAHYSWLVHHAAKLGDHLILVGDFNAAPWSWQMRRFAAASGLRRHGTYAASWPARLPVVLIDNLLTTPNIKSVSFKTGPDLGSDHLPIIAAVAVPP